MKNKNKNKNKTDRPQKQKEEGIIVDGTTIEAFPNATFDVELDNGSVLKCMVSGKMRKNKIFVIVPARVQVRISPYDLTRGTIIYLYK